MQIKFKLLKSLKLILILILITTTITGCSLHRHKKDANKAKEIVLTTEQEQNANIKTEKINLKLLQLNITIPAQFKAVNKFLDRIYAPIDGKVTQIFVEPGDIAKKGEALIQIKSDAIGQIQLDFLNNYIGVESNIKQMSAQYNLSKQTYKRESILFNEGISSRAEYQVAYAQMLKDKANLDSLKIQRRALIKVYAQRVALYGGSESTITKAMASKSIYPYVTLRANKTGVVLDRKVNPGEIIDQNRELFNIADLSTIWLVGYAFEKDAPLLKVGQNVRGEMEDKNGYVKGKLSYVASILDTEKKTLEVRADIPNKDYSLKPNMYSEMSVDIGQVNVLAVPNSALLQYGDYTFAFVKTKDHTYEQRKVVVGQKNEQYSEVKSGLKPDDIVVINGGFSLLGESIKQEEETEE